MFQIEPAAARDREELTRLYTLQKGRPFCFWTEEYPAPENLEDDLARGDLFVMKNEAGRIAAAAAAASICWSIPGISRPFASTVFSALKRWGNATCTGSISCE